MIYEKEYVVDNKFINGTNIKWLSTGNGEYIIGTSGGKTYFIKRNIHIRYPKKGLPKVVADQYKQEANAIKDKQNKLRNLMERGGLSLDKDHIAVEEKNFFDNEKMFTTVTGFIPNTFPKEHNFSDLSLDEFIQLAKDATILIKKLHECGVIHGDLKEGNMPVRQDGSKYIPYLIDFDTAYAKTDIPKVHESIGGSEGYQSPEIILYGVDEDALPETITPATDIFTLGLVFHRWRVGSFPSIDVDHGSVGLALCLDKEVILDDKLNVRIGDNYGATLKSLVNWMIAKEPSDRPSEDQVLKVLSDEASVPEKFHKGNDEKPFDLEVWSSHKLIGTLLTPDELRSKGLRSLKRLNEGGRDGLKYLVVSSDGTRQKLSIDELCDNGYATRKDAEVEAPWDEHMIEFEPTDVIIKKGYARIRRMQVGYRKRYLITSTRGLEFDKGHEWLISEGLAHLKKVSVDVDTPWPEHGSSYNLENLAILKVKEITKVDAGGRHCYRIVYQDRVQENVPGSNVRMMGLIRK